MSLTRFDAKLQYLLESRFVFVAQPLPENFWIRHSSFFFFKIRDVRLICLSRWNHWCINWRLFTTVHKYKWPCDLMVRTVGNWSGWNLQDLCQSDVRIYFCPIHRATWRKIVKVWRGGSFDAKAPPLTPSCPGFVPNAPCLCTLLCVLPLHPLYPAFMPSLCTQPVYPLHPAFAPFMPCLCALLIFEVFVSPPPLSSQISNKFNYTM